MTRKRRSSLSTEQLDFTFDAPDVPTGEAELAGFERFISACCARAMREDERSRYDLAAAMSKLLTQDVTKWSLDSYAAEGREDHKVPAERFFALIAITGRHDILDAVVTKIGARLLVGEEIHTARLGHIDRQIAALNAERKRVAALATPIERRGAN